MSVPVFSAPARALGPQDMLLDVMTDRRFVVLRRASAPRRRRSTSSPTGSSTFDAAPRDPLRPSSYPRPRCDFFSRPPRIVPAATERLFASAADPFLVVDLDSLIRMRRTPRAKDYAVIGELAARLPPAQEILLTTDPDRLMQLAPGYGEGVCGPPSWQG